MHNCFLKVLRRVASKNSVPQTINFFKMKKILKCSGIILLMVCSYAANAQIQENEKQYLIKLNKSTQGFKWKNEWNLNANPATWHGVEVKDGHVVSLKLYRNNLEGKIPEGISVLKKLETLNLSFNLLEGELPQGLFELQELKSIKLEMNKLSGEMPQDYSKMKKLEELTMFNNLLQGSIPSGIGSLENLKTLNLSSNYFDGRLPKSLENLKKLERLELFGNKLAGSIDVELGKLVHLKELILSYNQFEGDLPSSIASLSNLEFVQLQGNGFRSLNSLLRLESTKLAVFDSDDEFLNMKFSTNELSKSRLADTKYEDVKQN